MSELLREAIIELDSLLGIERATGTHRAGLRRFRDSENSLRMDLADITCRSRCDRVPARPIPAATRPQNGSSLRGYYACRSDQHFCRWKSMPQTPLGGAVDVRSPTARFIHVPLNGA